MLYDCADSDDSDDNYNLTNDVVMGCIVLGLYLTSCQSYNLSYTYPLTNYLSLDVIFQVRMDVRKCVGGKLKVLQVSMYLML